MQEDESYRILEEMNETEVLSFYFDSFILNSYNYVNNFLEDSKYGYL